MKYLPNSVVSPVFSKCRVGRKADGLLHRGRPLTPTHKTRLVFYWEYRDRRKAER